MDVSKLVKLLIPHEAKGLTYIDEEGINVNIPKALIDDKGNQIEVVEYSVISYILKQLEEYNDNELLKLYTVSHEQITTLLKDKEDLMRMLIKDKEEYIEALAQNKLYEEWYGKALSPFSILNQLYKYKKGEFEVLAPKSKWSKYKDDEASKYWIEMFQHWKIIRVEGMYNYFSLMSWAKAKDLIFSATYREDESIDIKIKKEYQK